MATTKRLPLKDVLVMLHGDAKAADILHRMFLVDGWPTCDGPHTCGKDGCGGKPAHLFAPGTVAVVRGWVADLTGTTGATA